ncbi:hypothetical protein PsorP6_016708 [Peronosclerospora sorghi]|uniref:Uncharacterized protein n=1 Tax=Peronosclerospora sorghi TaxID=230839 RepID=A0ACC0WBV1_9STRA|nr:hypothetical protein PsorP6_016708 [Peronosclerospora sorghi]
MVKALFFLLHTLLLIALLQARMEAESMESVMTVIHSRRPVKLNPIVQHIPLDPSKVHLRPPPAKIPETFNIFVGISVFRDGYRCGKTIFTGIKRARYPERLYFGIVDQVDAGDERCYDAYCKMAEAEWPEKGPCPYKEHIRVDVHSASESRGPTLARYHQQKLIEQEEFCLQVDGHSIFTNLWDENLLAEWKRVNNEMAVLSTYVHHMHNFIKDNGDNVISVPLPHLCATMRGRYGLVRNGGASMIKDSKFPQLQALWGAGLSFSKCHAERRVPVDSHTLWMFDGEEFLRASRLWTSGYDFYSPSLLGSVIYHNYSKVPARFEHITVNTEVKKREREMAVNRFYHLMGQPVKGLIDTFELDKYGFGSVRSFQTYLQFCGVTFQKGVNDTESCEQLHWVPYENATEVEALMGNGWKLFVPSVIPNLRQRPDFEIGIDKMKTPQHTNETGVKNDDANAEIEEQEAMAHINNDVGSGEVKVEKMEVLEVWDNPSPTGPSAAPVLFFLLIFVAAVFVNISNDRVSRLIRLKLYSASRSRSSSD